MGSLPVADIVDAHLADLMAAPGCPLCLERARSGRRFIDALLYEQVNDADFRRELDQARGFCGRHTHQLLTAEQERAGGLVRSAILFAAILAARQRELDAALAARGRRRRQRLATAVRAADCPACRHEVGATRRAAGRLRQLAADQTWRESLASTDFCLEHLLLLLDLAADDDNWLTISSAQGARFSRLREQLERFAHNSSYDRRHLISTDDRQAIRRAAAALGGEPQSGG
jgi:hypothetical protein